MLFQVRLVFPQALDFAGKNQVFVPAQRDAMLGGDSLRALGDKIHVGAFAEDLSGGANGIAQVLDAADTSASQRGAVHHEGVELHFAIAVEKAAAAGVKGLVVFHDDDRFLDRVERRPSALKHVPSGGAGIAHAVQVSLDHVIGNGPGAAVDDQNRIDRHFQSLQEVAGDSLASLLRQAETLDGKRCSLSYDWLPEDLLMKQFKRQLVVLILATVSSAQQASSPPASPGVTTDERGTVQTAPPAAHQERDSTSSTPPLIPSYPDTAEGLERMMGDMISLEKRGQTAELNSYLQSLVLPQPEVWFAARFGTVHCEEEKLGANDCLGPRIAFTYATITRDLPASFALTLKDLINEGLTNFEATDYTETCPGPQRIIASRKLVGGLTTTQILGGMQRHHESVYVLWIYNDTKETTLPFFVYSQGAFRYIGMPHEASVEDYQKKSIGGEGQTESAPSARYLTEDQLEMKEVIVDPAVVQRTVVLRVSLGKDGKVIEASYVRGPEAYKDAATQSVRKQRFDPPGFGPHGFHGNLLCVNVTAPR